MIVLAAVGFFGEGPASRAVAGHEGEALWVEYARFARLDADFRITIHVKDPSADRVVVRLHRDYVQGIEIRSISPAPVAEGFEGEWFSYEFQGDRTGASFVAHFDVTPRQPGLRQGLILQGDEEPLHFSQFVYP